MQKLTYTNTRGESITFGMDPPFLQGHIDGVGELDSEHLTTQTAGQDGVSDHGALLLPREITITGTLYEIDARRDMYGLRKRMGDVLNPKLTGQLVYQNDLGAWCINARPLKLPVYGVRFKHMLPYIMYFTCPSPFWEAITAERVILGDSVGGLRFPLILPTRFALTASRLTVHNPGQAEAPIYAQFSGAAEWPALTNETTGESIMVERDLANGDTLIINTDLRENFARIIRADGSEEDATAWLSLTSVFWKLLPGDNVVSYTSHNEASKNRITILFYPRYVGV